MFSLWKHNNCMLVYFHRNFLLWMPPPGRSDCRERDSRCFSGTQRQSGCFQWVSRANMDIAFVCYRTTFGINLITITDLIFIVCLTSRTPYCYLHQEVCFHPCLFVGWFVSWITQKLQNRSPWNLDEGWVSAQNRPPCTFGADPDKGTDLGSFVSHFL